ncbi:MAG: hypothetical protein LBD01_01280 [Puniceicoccales bacterium]|jgi:hypothetical protein|nr:hypothetical protein [Puniceicoccales bacterium]
MPRSSNTQFLDPPKRRGSITALFSALVLLAQVSFAHAGGIGIISATKFRCVDLIFWLEDNPTKTEADAPVAYQKTRTVVGIGEIISLTIVGEEKMIGDESKIKWSIPEGGDYAAFIINRDKPDERVTSTFEGKKTVELLIYLNTSESNNKSVKVAVATSAPASANIKFTIKTPAGGFKSRQFRPPKHYWWVASGNVGASAKLRVFPTPTSVNFEGGVGLLETDEGSPLDVKPSAEDEKKGVEASTFKNFKHSPPKIYLRIGQVEGGTIDNVGFRRWVLGRGDARFNYKEMTASHSCYWRCGWHWREMITNGGVWDGDANNRGEKMQSVNQIFHIANDGKGTGTVTKFDSKVTRVAKDNKTNTQTYE